MRKQMDLHRIKPSIMMLPLQEAMQVVQMNRELRMTPQAMKVKKSKISSKEINSSKKSQSSVNLLLRAIESNELSEEQLLEIAGKLGVSV